MKKGFTIVELIIVIAVIGVLAAILIPTFANVIKKANHKSALSDAKNTISTFLSAVSDGAGGAVVGEGSYVVVKKSDTKFYSFKYEKGGLKVALDGNGDEILDPATTFATPVGTFAAIYGNSAQTVVAVAPANMIEVDELNDNVLLYNTIS